MADRHPTRVVPARPPLLGLEERLVRLVGRDLLEGRPGHEPATGRGGLVASERHGQTPSKNVIFWPGARVTIAFRQGVVQPMTRPRFVPRRFSFGFVVRTLTLTTVTFSLA